MPVAMQSSNYLMSGSVFSYHKLSKLPSTSQEQCAVVVSAQDLYCDHYHVGGTRRRATWRSFGGGGGGRRRRTRLRISSLTRVLRRKAAAVGGKVSAAVAKVVGRLREGSPYVADLFAGNYMFLQVTPTPTSTSMAGLDKHKGFLPPYYHHGGGIDKSKLASSWRHRPVSVPGVLYKV